MTNEVCLRRYGQEEEDRQWDSGGGGVGGGQQHYYGGSYQVRDEYKNQINQSRTKRCSSNKDLTRGFSESVDEEVSCFTTYFRFLIAEI